MASRRMHQRVLRCVAIGLALTIGDSAARDDRQPRFAPAPEIVTGSERMGWHQTAVDADELGRLRYAVYVDGGLRIPLAGASCEPAADPSGFWCTAPLPALSSGRHILEVVALAQFGDVEIESPKSTRLSIVVSVVGSLQRPASSQAAQRSGPSTRLYRFTTQDGAHLAVEMYASNLDSPAAIAFSPDARLFVAERYSQIRVVGEPASSMPALSLRDLLDRGETGSFVDVAVHPGFERNHLMYVLYKVQTPAKRSAYRLARFREVNGTLAQRAVLRDEIPAGPGRDVATVRFGPDHRLYLGIEDLAPHSVAQDLASMNGKILRLNDDGTVPRDNPLASPVFSYGHRAPVGLAWHPETGDLWEIERGPNDEGELILVTPKTDYGWPDARPLQSAHVAQPRFALGSFVAPAGATFYMGARIPEFRNDLFFASLGHRSLCRVRFDAANPRRVVAIESLLENRFGTIGDVTTGPDGALYFLSSNRAAAEGRHRGQLLRIIPDATAR